MPWGRFWCSSPPLDTGKSMVSMGVSRSKTVDVIWCFPPFIELLVWLTLVPFKSLSGQIRIIYSSYSYWKFKNSNFNISVKVHCGFLLHIQWSKFPAYNSAYRKPQYLPHCLLNSRFKGRVTTVPLRKGHAYLQMESDLQSTVPLYYFRILLPS